MQMTPCAAGVAVVTAAIFVAASCGSDRSKNQVGNTDIGLSQRRSGYTGTVADWRRFLSCWYRESVRIGKDLAFSPIERDVLGPGVDLVASEAAYRRRIVDRQAELGVELPASYVDFLLAYQPNATYGPGGDEPDSFSRLVDVGVVATMGVARPAFVSGLLGAAGGATTDDSRYFVYGSRQDLAALRPEYAAKSLLVGWHGSDHFAMIALHPQVRTLDGEMEAIAYEWEVSFRAPSFAELMRHLYARKVRRWVGGRSEQELRSTCARHLPMENWWEP